MKFIKGDLFHHQCDAICITTNGYIKKNGEAVCGRGCALEARKRWTGFAIKLGNRIKFNGNKVQIVLLDEPALKGFPKYILSFPVKHNWWESADLKLIEKSCKELLDLIVFYNWKKVVLPKPGCGNGKLNWKKQVKPIIEKYFKEDQRLFIIDKE